MKTDHPTESHVETYEILELTKDGVQINKKGLTFYEAMRYMRSINLDANVLGAHIRRSTWRTPEASGETDEQVADPAPAGRC